MRNCPGRVSPFVDPEEISFEIELGGSLAVILGPVILGSFAVNEKEVNGNVSAFGFPASIEIIPGRSSRGYNPRT